MQIQILLLLAVAALCALYAARELAPARWSAVVAALHRRARVLAPPPREARAPIPRPGALGDAPAARALRGASPASPGRHAAPAWGWARRRRNVLLATYGAIVVLIAVAALFAERTPVHLRLVSAGARATLTVGGESHTFAWPAPPTRVALPRNDPGSREWGIDGSQSLTASIANLDPTYLRGIADNPYVAFDRWLRGEDGYDDWRNLRLGSPTSETVTLPATAQTPNGFPVGRAFTIDGDIYRLEQPVSVQLVSSMGTFTIRLDRASRVVTVDDTPTTGGSTTTVAQWYFPTDPWPFLAVNARTLAYAVIWAALLILLAIALGALLPARAGDRAAALWTRARARPTASIAPLAALAVFFAAALYIALGEYNGMPHIFDAQAYFFQAKVLASGHLSMPVPPLADSFPIPFFGAVNGRWAAQYGPGTALTLVPGMLLGLPWLVQPVLAVGTLALVGAIGRRLYGPWVAALSVILGALSPFFLFQVGAYFSHIQAAFFITLAYYLLARGEWGRRLGPTASAGASLGMAFLCREITALLIAVPLTVGLATHVWGRRRGWRDVAAPVLAWAGGAGLFGLLYILYDWSITGNPLLSPRGVMNPSDRYGFGAGHGWWGVHTLAAALTNTDQLLTGLALDLYGWPYYMALAVPLLALIPGRANRWDALNGAIVAIVIVGMMGYFYNGIAIGPRYYFEAVPALLLLTARGVQAMGVVAGDILARMRRARFGGTLAAGAILVALVLPNMFFYLPRHVALYRNFTAMAWMPNLQLSRIYAGAPRHAIVVTGDSYIFSNVLAALNNPADLAAPSATGGTVWALASTPQRYDELRAAFPHRNLFILQTTGATVSYQPYGTRAGA